MRPKLRWWFSLGLCIALLSACVSETFSAHSFETAIQVLQQKILPQISVVEAYVPDEIAAQYVTNAVQEPLPSLDRFPVHGAQPSDDPDTVYLEIFSSAEKANARKQDERWLLDVIEAFNAKQFSVRSGATIRVGVRNIPSGTAQRLIAAQAAQPAGYTPSHELWLEMLKQDGINLRPVTSALLPSNAGFVIQNSLKQELVGDRELTFEQLLDGILAGKVTIGYTNPFTSSTGLNLLYTLFWYAAGHHQDRQPLTIADLNSPRVQSVFQAFQEQVLLTALVTPDLKDIFIRDPQKLPAFAIDYLSYATLKQLPEFAQTQYIPFGVPHNSPLVGFDWNTPEQQEALKQFADFATSTAMQQLAPAKGPDVTAYLQRQDLPLLPAGDVLTAAQSFWKSQKDAGRTVYMMTVVDTSGSMEGEPLDAVKTALQLAGQEINPGNHIGLVTFDSQPMRRIPLAPFDTLQHQRWLAAIDTLQADGETAMYDGMMVALSDLMAQKRQDPNGRFYLLVLTDGMTNRGFQFNQVKEILAHSGVRMYPIAYGSVNQQELNAIAALRESTVKTGTPETVQTLLKDLFQTNL